MEFCKPVTPIDDHFWIAVYDDGSHDAEGEGRIYQDLIFSHIDHFTCWPKIGAQYQIAICIKKIKGYRLIWRKQRHVTTIGEYKGSDYMLGLEPDDGSELLKHVENGTHGADPHDIAKNNPDGFRIWLTKEGEIRIAGAFKKTETIQSVDDVNIKYIECEIE